MTIETPRPLDDAALASAKRVLPKSVAALEELEAIVARLVQANQIIDVPPTLKGNSHD